MRDKDSLVQKCVRYSLDGATLADVHHKALPHAASPVACGTVVRRLWPYTSQGLTLAKLGLARSG